MTNLWDAHQAGEVVDQTALMIYLAGLEDTTQAQDDYYMSVRKAAKAEKAKAEAIAKSENDLASIIGDGEIVLRAIYARAFAMGYKGISASLDISDCVDVVVDVVDGKPIMQSYSLSGPKFTLLKSVPLPIASSIGTTSTNNDDLREAEKLAKLHLASQTKLPHIWNCKPSEFRPFASVDLQVKIDALRLASKSDARFSNPKSKKWYLHLISWEIARMIIADLGVDHASLAKFRI